MRQAKATIVNVYEMEDNWEKYRVLSFEEENEKWLEFVCACRKGEPLNKDYDIIKAIADLKQLELRVAFDIYYSSKLAGQIADSSYGIENMDAKYLAEDLIENEPELF